jgi:CHAT domain-containing protein
MKPTLRALTLLLVLAAGPGFGAPEKELTLAEQNELADKAWQLKAKAGELRQQGDYAGAVAALREALDIGYKLSPKERYPNGHPNLVLLLIDLGKCLGEQGEPARAETCLREALEMGRKLFPREKYPDGSHHVANALAALGELLWSKGDFAKAEAPLREALAMRRKLCPKELHPDGHPLLVESLRALGTFLWRKGDPAEGEPLMREALTMCRRLYPREKYPDGHSQTALTLEVMGDFLSEGGEPAKAEPLYREALAMCRRLYPKEKYPRGHPNLARALHNLAVVLWDLDKNSEVESLLREALEAYRRVYPREQFAAGHAEVARHLEMLARFLVGQYDLERAEPYAAEAVAMCRRLYPPDQFPNGHPLLAGSLDTLGMVLVDKEGYTRAEPLLREAVGMWRKQLPKDKYPDGHLRLAHALGHLGLLFANQGEYAQGEATLREALEMLRRLYPREKYPDGHPGMIHALANLSSVLRDQEKNAEAVALCREAVAMCRRLYPKEKYPQGHPALTYGLVDLGYALQSQGRYADAAAAYREALELRRRLYPPEKYPDGHEQLDCVLNNLGLVLQLAGEYDKAEPLLAESLAMCRRLYPREKYPDGHPHLACTLRNVGILAYSRGEGDRAEPLLREALEMIGRLTASYAASTSEAASLNYAGAQAGSPTFFLSAISRHASRPEDYEPVWAWKGAFLRLAEYRHRNLVASQDPEARRLGAQLRDARQRLAEALLNPARDPEQQRKEVEARTRAKEDLERRLAERLQSSPARPAPADLTPKRLAERLPEGSCFIDLFRYLDYEYDPRRPGAEGLKMTPRYVAFVVCPGRPARRVDLGTAKPIEDAWAAWHNALTASRPDNRAEREAAAAFARLVWGPLREQLPARPQTVYLSADGVLNWVPWGALPGRKPDTVLLDECAVCLAPNGPFLLERLDAPARPPRPGDRLVVYGGIDYDGPPATAGPEDARRGPPPGGKRVVWKELPGTAREQRQLADLAGKFLKDSPLIRSGRQANTAQLREDLPKARYAHLATHGFFAGPEVRKALRLDASSFEIAEARDRRGAARSLLVLSGLVLAGANREGKEAAPDRGIVTGESLVSLPLEDLELAVLSACETGVGLAVGEEGVYSLQRAFHVAGCKGVVASLWKVDDGATQVLMALFYRNLWQKKLDPAEALRQAQLTLYRHPEAPAVAKKRGPADFTESDLPKAEDRPSGQPKHAPTAQWAAFTFSGVRPPEAKGR